MQACCDEIRSYIDPLAQLTRADVARLEAAEAARAALADRLQALKMQAAALE